MEKRHWWGFWRCFEGLGEGIQLIFYICLWLSSFPQQEVGSNGCSLASCSCTGDGSRWGKVQGEEGCDSTGHNLTAGEAALICKMCSSMATGDKNLLRECRNHKQRLANECRFWFCGVFLSEHQTYFLFLFPPSHKGFQECYSRKRKSIQMSAFVYEMVSTAQGKAVLHKTIFLV